MVMTNLCHVVGLHQNETISFQGEQIRTRAVFMPRTHKALSFNIAQDRSLISFISGMSYVNSEKRILADSERQYLLATGERLMRKNRDASPPNRNPIIDSLRSHASKNAC